MIRPPPASTRFSTARPAPRGRNARWERGPGHGQSQGPERDHERDGPASLRTWRACSGPNLADKMWAEKPCRDAHTWSAASHRHPPPPQSNETITVFPKASTRRLAFAFLAQAVCLHVLATARAMRRTCFRPRRGEAAASGAAEPAPHCLNAPRPHDHKLARRARQHLHRSPSRKRLRSKPRPGSVACKLLRARTLRRLCALSV
jgi:hypothetical protein